MSLDTIDRFIAKIRVSQKKSSLRGRHFNIIQEQATSPEIIRIYHLILHDDTSYF